MIINFLIKILNNLLLNRYSRKILILKFKLIVIESRKKAIVRFFYKNWKIVMNFKYLNSNHSNRIYRKKVEIWNLVHLILLIMIFLLGMIRKNRLMILYYSVLINQKNHLFDEIHLKDWFLGIVKMKVKINNQIFQFLILKIIKL